MIQDPVSGIERDGWMDPGSQGSHTENHRFSGSPNVRDDVSTDYASVPYSNTSGNFLRISAASSGEVWATLGKLSMRSYGMQASITTREL